MPFALQLAGAVPASLMSSLVLAGISGPHSSFFAARAVAIDRALALGGGYAPALMMIVVASKVAVAGKTLAHMAAHGVVDLFVGTHGG